jgi:hypothetical protein
VKLAGWKEPIAATGVILSLLLLTYEVRQNTNVSRAQARQDLAALNQEWLVLLSQDADFHELFWRAWVEQDSLGPQEWSRARFMMTIGIRRLENVFFQYSQGLVTESALSSYGFQGGDQYRSRAFRDYWYRDNWRNAFDPAFVRFFESRFGLEP